MGLSTVWVKVGQGGPGGTANVVPELCGKEWHLTKVFKDREANPPLQLSCGLFRKVSNAHMHLREWILSGRHGKRLVQDGNVDWRPGHGSWKPGCSLGLRED